MMPNYNESLRTQIWVCESSNICATWTGGSVLSRESNIRPTVLPTFDIKDNWDPDFITIFVALQLRVTLAILAMFFRIDPKVQYVHKMLNLFYDPNVKQMQPMWLNLFSGRQFKETFEEAQQRKVKQMQPMRLSIL